MNTRFSYPIKVRTKTDIYSIDNIEENPFYEDFAHDIKILTDSINEILKRTHIKKNHFYLKKWIDDIYHNRTTENINSDDLTKIKGLVGEFIAETDDYILDEHLKERIKEYKNMKRNKERL